MRGRSRRLSECVRVCGGLAEVRIGPGHRLQEGPRQPPFNFNGLEMSCS